MLPTFRGPVRTPAAPVPTPAPISASGVGAHPPQVPTDQTKVPNDQTSPPTGPLEMLTDDSTVPRDCSVESTGHLTGPTRHPFTSGDQTNKKSAHFLRNNRPRRHEESSYRQAELKPRLRSGAHPDRRPRIGNHRSTQLARGDDHRLRRTGESGCGDADWRYADGSG